MALNNWKQTSEKLGGVSRALIFILWRDNQLGSVKVGKLRFSTDEQIDAFIEKQSTDGAGA